MKIITYYVIIKKEKKVGVLGIEPRSQLHKSCALTIELHSHNYYK